MKLDRRTNTKNGIFYGTLNKTAVLLFPFIIQTIVIKMLGAEYVGLKGLFSSILTVLNLSELGIGSAITYSMYKPIANDDTDTISALLNLYRTVYRIIGAVVLVVGIATMPYLPHLIKGTWPEDINIYILFSLVLADTVLSYWAFAYKSVLFSAHQRNDVISQISISANTFMYIAQIILLLVTRNFYLYFAVSIAKTVLINILVYNRAGKMFPKIQCKGSIPATIKSKIKFQIAGLSISKLCQVTRNTFDSIFISAFLGLTATGIYSNYYCILSALSGFVTIVSSSLLAGIGNTIATESPQKNYTEMLKLDFIYMIASGWMTTCLACLYQPFMKLWVGEELTLPNSVMIIFPIYFYILRMGSLRDVYSNAAGLFWEDRNRKLAEAIVNIILNYLFVKLWGIFGIVLATCLSIAFIGFPFSAAVAFKHYFKAGIARYFINQFKYLMVTLLVCSITIATCLWFDKILQNPSTWLTLFIRAILCITFVPILYWSILHKTHSYKSSMKMIRKSQP